MRKKSIRQKKKSTSTTLLFVVLFLLLGISVTVYSLGQSFFLQSKADSGKIIILQPNPDVAHANLQLRTFPYITVPEAPSMPPPAPNVTPPSGGYCPLDALATNNCQCLDSNAYACPAPGANVGYAVPQCPPEYRIPFRLPPGTGKWFCVKLVSPGMTDPNPPPPPAGCYKACIAKPVVYLYPTEKTLVDVRVRTPGEIFVSDPLYPSGGWKNVEAHPDGKLIYQGKTYRELFYESTVVKKIEMPEKGILIRSDEIEPELRRITTQLGLINGEQTEFLEYWVPVLQSLKAPYIYFSILPPEVKDEYDHLTISPEPDTRIEFIAYFKGFQKPFTVTPLELPAQPPVRTGFTEVEWGGTVGE